MEYLIILAEEFHHPLKIEIGKAYLNLFHPIMISHPLVMADHAYCLKMYFEIVFYYYISHKGALFTYILKEVGNRNLLRE